MPKKDAYATDEDKPLTVDAPGVLENDDPNRDHLTAEKASDPSNGTLTPHKNGSLTYTPNRNFNGTGSFTYRTSDGNARSKLTTVSITVDPINDAPVARDDSYKTREDKTLRVPLPGVLDGDPDLDGDALKAIKVSSPKNGKLALSANGSFVHRPKKDFSGIDSFTYRANDGLSRSNVARVTIKVKGAKEPGRNRGPIRAAAP